MYKTLKFVNVFSAGILAVVVAAILLLSASLGPAQAQKLPNPVTQEVLIKATLLTFNDANVTGIYTVLHAKLSKPFRDQFSADKLKEVFKVFADKHIDFDIIAAKKPISTQDAAVSDRGELEMKGYFDTTPSHVYYDLKFILSEGEWKPIRINVDVKRPDSVDKK
jgi:hypothetical protein